LYCREEYLEELKKKIGVEWNNLCLLEESLTHGSYVYENKEAGVRDNQRLEFLGDAVLELVVSDYLFRSRPDLDEGALTKLRAAVVCESSLARAAREVGLGRCLRMGRGEEKSGGRDRPSILADALEALLGAVYLDRGLEEAKRLAVLLLGPALKGAVKGDTEPDYKTELQELVQKKWSEQVRYAILKEEGPDHQKSFTAGVYFRGELVGSGKGHSKKDAEQQAAKAALAGALFKSDKNNKK